MARARAGLGLAGANLPSLAEAIRKIPLGFASVVVASDAVAACLGAHGGRDGAVLILGTGSQGLAILSGHATTIGGWGFALSDDASGATLGRSAVRSGEWRTTGNAWKPRISQAQKPWKSSALAMNQTGRGVQPPMMAGSTAPT